MAFHPLLFLAILLPFCVSFLLPLSIQRSCSPPRTVAPAATSAEGPPATATAATTTTSVCLAVDLGNKHTGLALFNATGSLLRYFSREFSPVADDRQPQVVALLTELEPKPTHVVLEGDTLLYAQWEAAILDTLAHPPATVLAVAPSEWRAKMLLKKEAQSSATAKAAARLISRQIVYRAGLADGYVEGPMDTDAAEAILLGFYAVRAKLGWVVHDAAQQRQQQFLPTLVERYTNGNVVLPPKTRGTSRGGHGEGEQRGGGV